MRTHPHPRPPGPALRRGQGGAAIVEFALIAVIFFTLLLGIMEFGRWMFTLNAAGEATRLGARLAVVCSNAAGDVTNIKAKMRGILGGVSDAQIVIQYNPVANCDTDWTATTNRCESVTVELLQGDAGMKFTPLIPFLGISGSSFAIPPFTTTLTREFMKSTDNPVCP